MSAADNASTADPASARVPAGGESNAIAGETSDFRWLSCLLFFFILFVFGYDGRFSKKIGQMPPQRQSATLQRYKSAKSQ